ncbi:3beta-hydroxysteroid-dehydrogenase/decarboxylase-like [Cynara cardunculus var. scolymus]|uniref:3beta-hydroxysteroid- dehydrogenase/decarboxylase-like n=1 Tax=Cynara cardunculus var. scolymus TaxID=59895 RepID=UPI000D626F92|nr:3beta-hydroxysteroid-dehydrogenase/decarboxylase-like [Cynara cardunculus var. scolymus]XP_024969448.1 3beta-hydroxysteroid-dehydrogenase/decarboxylase-like [Cynara cardunculus var. scolymus]XP_024969449.1 3beta-hydroxysteroid-dehydrogenase/decarboxylase-like [Cynara cardunculus var. scolymus]XP_024969450.1 3beta-hydroxysteroid-dehydrogenase/decarboxylase-like [Cynara cardunculus var. scolymus]
MSAPQERWCVVTGGRGFAARHLVDMLIRYEIYSVRIADLAPDIKLETHEEKGNLGQALRLGRAQYVSMDLCDKSQVNKACEGAEVVFHMAAPDSSINNYKLHYAVNVQGTKNVIDACTKLNVKRLIYTSSPSVVFDGVHGIYNGDESLPYAAKHNDSYSETKAEGEALVIKANGINGLLTCCIRPSSIFGPGDKLLVPSLVAAARAGKSKFIIGDGTNMYDFTYVENVAHAHVCAERALASDGSASKRAAGEAYFVTNMEPIKFWEFMSLILVGLGYERPRIKIPAAVMMPIAHLVERTYNILAPYGMKVPQLTPSRIRLLTCNRTFNSGKANDRLGYIPIVPLQEGLKRTIESYPDLRAELLPRKEGPSKAAVYLGNGIVADILLWRDTKLTFTGMLALIVFYVSFVLPGSTMITAVSKVLMWASILIFIHGKLPNHLMGYSVEKIPESKFQCSEEMSRRTALSVASSWNCAVNNLKSISSGHDWTLFFKMAISLFIVSCIGSMSLQSFFLKVVPFSFVVFYIYDQYEDEVDRIVQTVIPIERLSNPDFLRLLNPFKPLDKQH